MVSTRVSLNFPAMIRAVRSAVFPFASLYSAEPSPHRVLTRSYTYSQPFPYYDEPVARHQPEPYPKYYADRFGYQTDPNLGQFYRHQFRGEYSPYYPVRVPWRGYGPECYCRCCGRPYYPHYMPVNYSVGYYSYDRSCGDQMRSDPTRNYNGSGLDGRDRRSLGYEKPISTNVGDSGSYSRNPNGNVGNHGHMSANGYYDRRGVPQENWPEEKMIHPQQGGGDGRSRNAWSGSNYNQYGPEYSAYSSGNGLYQHNGYVEHNDRRFGNQTRLDNNGRFVNGQPQDATVNGQLMNSHGISGEFQHPRQSPQTSNVLKNESHNHHGTREHNQNASNYGQPRVWGNYDHQNLNRPNNDNLIGLHRNSSMSHGQDSKPYSNSRQYQKRFSAADLAETARIFEGNQAFKQDSANVGYPQTSDQSGRNLHSLGPHPGFAATNQPLSPNVTSAENIQPPNINESRNGGGNLTHTIVDSGNDVSNQSNNAAGRCQRIIDVLESEDKHGTPGPANRFVSESRNEYGYRNN